MSRETELKRNDHRIVHEWKTNDKQFCMLATKTNNPVYGLWSIVGETWEYDRHVPTLVGMEFERVLNALKELSNGYSIKSQAVAAAILEGR